MRFFMDVFHPRCVFDLDVWRNMGYLLLRGGDLLDKINTVQKKRYYFFDNPSHPTAEEMIDFDRDAWSRFFKFCFVRNPYERAVSDYIWRVESRGKDVSFGDFLRRIRNIDMEDPEGVVPTPSTNWPIYTINDEVAVDFVGRYENMMVDLERVCEEVGIPFDKSIIPVTKKKKDYDYRSYYNSYEIGLVEEIYGKEIEMFGYSF